MVTLSFGNAFFEILLFVVVIIVFISVGSFFIVRDLYKEKKNIYRVRSRFHIEIRKIVNLIYNVHNSKYLEPFTKVVIKNLPHEEKKILLKNIDLAMEELDEEISDNKYIFETYENLQKQRRERDAKLLVYNQKLQTFPFSIYSKILKMEKYKLYTDNE